VNLYTKYIDKEEVSIVTMKENPDVSEIPEVRGKRKKSKSNQKFI